MRHVPCLLTVPLCLALSLAACGDDGGSAVDALDIPDGAIASCTPASGTTTTLTPVATGLVNPLLLTAPVGDARLFIVEQPGRIRIVKDGNLLPDPFLDLRQSVFDGENEMGLLGLAFHPNYAVNGRFWIHYNIDTGGDPRFQSIVAEMHAEPTADVADAGEVRRLITLDQRAGNHNGGMIDIGPDGHLYIAFGDEGGSNDTFGNGQNLDTLHGSIVRLDINTGMPPADNPFVGVNGRDEIWSYGWRNPWRFSFDRMTGDLYVGDVGQGEREEISVQPASSTGGENYGWPLCEGDRDFDDTCNNASLVPPATVQNHGGGRCSITGGYVYRGTCMPDLQGWYFYGDYCSGQIWRFQWSGGVATNEVEVTSEIGTDRLTSFGQDGLGELYTINRNGTVYRIGLP